MNEDAAIKCGSCTSYLPTETWCTKQLFSVTADRVSCEYHQPTQQTEALNDTLREVTLDEVAEILSSTVVRDRTSKLIIFQTLLLNYTSSDQMAIIAAGESSSGKSYLPIELTQYLPQEDVQKLGSASPTSFFYEGGILRNADGTPWTPNKETKTYPDHTYLDLHQKIIIFLDAPDPRLLERLRSFISQDDRQITIKSTNRSTSGAFRTRKVVLNGFPTIIFCTASFKLEDQEKSRFLLLSPSTDAAKLTEALEMILLREGSRQQFTKWLEEHPQRQWLRQRVKAIKDAKIEEVTITDAQQQVILERFTRDHTQFAPRSMRDIKRLMRLCKSVALLNYAHREADPNNPKIIYANDKDIAEGYALYLGVSTPNELGLAPQIYEMLTECWVPILANGDTATRQELRDAYYRHYGRFINEFKLRNEVIPQLVAVGLIIEETDPDDRRRTLIRLTSSGVEKLLPTPPPTQQATLGDNAK